MEKIVNHPVSIEDLPIIDFKFFQRTLKLKCLEFSRYSHKDYLFDLLTYSYNGNFLRIIRMFDKKGIKCLGDFEIKITTIWQKGYLLVIQKVNSKTCIKKDYSRCYSQDILVNHFEQLILINEILKGNYFEDSLILDFFKFLAFED